MADKTTILYIEDDLGSQMLVQRMLSFAGYRVIVASRGIEGIDMAQRELPSLILMDINLPDLSGREVTTRLRSDERFKTIPIVALTSQSQTSERDLAMAAGVTGYLNKPVDVDRLPAQVAHYLQGGKDTIDEVVLRKAQVAYSQEVVTRLEAKIRELERSNAELRRLDKIKDDFIQLTAHELRTPLTLIYGYSRLLQDSPIVKKLKAEASDVSMFVDGLVELIERMVKVINEILTISRIASGRVDLNITPTNLATITAAVIKNYQEAAQKRNLLINFTPSQWPVTLHGDFELLELCLHNLLGNAIKYTPDGGLITLSCRVGANNAVILIQDSGIGINKDDQVRIFDRFYTASDTQLHSTSKTAFRGGGLGLGLAISQGVIEAHGGRLWVESEGRDEEKLPGSTFYIELPLQAHTSTPQHKLP